MRASWFVTVLCAVMFAASLGLVGINTMNRGAAVADANHETCVQVQGLKRVISDQLKRAKLTLPTLTYYKQHPAELRQQLRLVNEQLVEFRPRTCS